jgi:undecaprenyl-diphosphatase
MNLKFQLSKAFVLSFISLIGFAFMALLVSANSIVKFDSQVISLVQGMEAPFLTKVMKFFTLIGSTKVVVFLFLFFLIIFYTVFRHRSELILFTAVVVCTPLLNLALKYFFHRTRPDLHRLIEIGGYSFPSGHAMSAFAFYGILSFLLWRHIPTRWGRTILILISIFMIAMIGTSRIYLGVHYPSDVIAGYFASGCWLAFAIWYFQRYRDRASKKGMPQVN